jgi:hypothetical protein
LFLVSCSAEEFFSFSSGLVFRIMDYDSVSRNEVVGFIAVNQVELLQMTGERVTLDLVVPEQLEEKLMKRGVRNAYSPKLNIRCRRATPEDIRFVLELRKVSRSKKEGIHEDAAFVAPSKTSVGLFTREHKKVDGVTLHRVKPGPDPTRKFVCACMTCRTLP